MTTKSVLTTYGNDKILEAIAEESTVSISSIVYGDGNGTDYEPSVDQTALVHQIGKLTSIVKEFNPTDGFIYFKATIPANANSFTLREFGLMDNNDNLISVTVIPGIEKPISSEGVSIALPISIGFKTSTGELMVIVEDGTDVYATTSLDNLNNRGEHHFDTTYATVGLNNLSLEGERHFLGRTHITNCITEIPQKINCTLDNGTLAIKAGSTIIVPYGTIDLSSTYPIASVFLNQNFKVAATQYVNNQFFVWAEVQADITTTYTTGAYNLSVFVDIENNALLSYSRLTDGSGNTDPAGTTTFYNTSTNIINRYSAGTVTAANLSFPIARITTTSSQIASIDEIANGSNHIGNTLILDKDVRLLIPNGRNENGSLNNEAIITSSITFGYVDTMFTGTYEYFYDYTSNSIAIWPRNIVFSTPPNDALNTNRLYYDFTTNKFTQYFNLVKTQHLYCHIGSFISDKATAKITEFNAKFDFRAMDYNDLAVIEKQFSSLLMKVGTPIFTLDINATLPENCIWLEGAEVLIADYPLLYAIYGTNYGIPTDPAKFFLPNYKNYYVCGTDNAITAGYVSAALPNLGLSMTSAGGHDHDRGNMNITGWCNQQNNDIGILTQGGGYGGAFIRGSYKSNRPEGHFGDGSYDLVLDAWRGWTGRTSWEGDHTHSITSSSPLVGASNTVKTNGIKHRVYTRYQ